MTKDHDFEPLTMQADDTQSADTMQEDSNKKHDSSQGLKKVTKSRKRIHKGWLFFSSLLGIYVLWLLVGAFWLPNFTRESLEATLREKFRTEATVEAISFNPFTFNLVIHNLRIPNPSGEGVLFSCTALDFSPSASRVWDLAPALAHAKLVEPIVDVTYFGDGRFSFSQVLDDVLAPSAEQDADVIADADTIAEAAPNAEATLNTENTSDTESASDVASVMSAENQASEESTSTAEAEPLFPFAISDFELVNGTINYRNDVLGVEHNITDINFVVPFTSTIESFKATPVLPVLSAKINGSEMKVEGNTLPFSDDFTTQFSLITDDISLSPFKKYIHDYTELDLVDGKTRFELNFNVRRLSDVDIELGLSGSFFVHDFVLHNPHEQVVASLKSGEVSIDTFTLAERKLHLEKVALDGLYLKACKKLDGSIDWQQWIAGAQENFATDKSAEVETSSSFEVAGATLALTNSRLEWRDESLAGSKEIALTDIQILVPYFSTADAGHAAFTAQLGVNDKGLFDAKGDLTFAPLTATARLQVADMPLSIIRPFLGTSLIDDVEGALHAEALVAYGTTISASGERFSAEAAQGAEAVQIVQSEGGLAPVIVQDATVSISNLSLGRAGKKNAKPLFALKNIALQGINVDLPKKQVLIDALNIVAPEVHATLNKRKGLVVESGGKWITAEEYGKAPSKKGAAKQNASNATQASASAAKTGSTAGTASAIVLPAELQGWNIELSKLAMEQGSIDIAMVRGKKNKLFPIANFSQMSFSTGALFLDLEKSIDFSFATHWLEKGQLQIDGQFTPQPLVADMQIKAKHMDLSPFDALVAAQTDLQMNGLLFSNLHCRVHLDAKTGEPFVALNGNARLNSVALRELGSANNFFSLRSFNVKAIDIDTKKMTAKVGAVDIETPYISIQMDKYGVTNAERALSPELALAKYNEANAEIVSATQERATKKEARQAARAEKAKAEGKEKPAKEEKETAESTPPNMVEFSSFVMDGLSIKGGSFFFQDERHAHPYRLRMNEIEASCTNFSLAPESRSEVTVTAKVEGVPFVMQGLMNPVMIPPFADMTARIANLNLVPMSPYSLEYIAYPVSKGNLTADLTLKTEDWAVDANSAFVLENFELGPYDSRPDAPSYPIKLGLSLLRGIDGNVSIDLPIKGRLDDPDFHVGGIVMKAITNLMVRIVASPFALLGGVLSLGFGGSDDDDGDRVSFASGGKGLDMTAQQRVTTTIELLRKRPALKLTLNGHYNSVEDGRMLCVIDLLGPMKEEKFASLPPQQQAKTTVEAMRIDPNEYDRFLRRLYVQSPGEKELNEKGRPKAISRKEMEDVLLKGVQCSRQALDALAKARAKSVYDSIAQQAPELMSRITIGSGAGGEGSLVLFGLE